MGGRGIRECYCLITSPPPHTHYLISSAQTIYIVIKTAAACLKRTTKGEHGLNEKGYDMLPLILAGADLPSLCRRIFSCQERTSATLDLSKESSSSYLH